MRFTFYKQLNAMDCGPTCLRMISKYYGKHYNADTLRQIAGFNKAGVSLLGISSTAEKLGFRTRGVKISFEQLQQVQLPCILHWNQNHFVVLLQISNSKIKVADPAEGIVTYKKSEFLQHWMTTKSTTELGNGIVLMLEPTPKFYENESEKEDKLSWNLVIKYLVRSKGKITQVFIALFIGLVLQLILPFLTQSIVDTGINTQNLDFVVVILIAQLMLTISQTISNFIRTRLLLRISNQINLQILSDFWIKLTRLPVSYFDLHPTGDIMQRIHDHSRIQLFLSGPALTTLFSTLNFVVYAIILVNYNFNLFLIFSLGSALYLGWVLLFLRIRRKINFQAFNLSSRENNATLQLIQGMQEVRLNNAEKQKRWEWEGIQASIFKLNFKSLNYDQWQATGATLINQTQNIFISFLVAKLVIVGSLTLGAMLAVQYIIGQLTGPILQWIDFVQSAQNAKISMERLNEIHQLKDEEDPEKSYIFQMPKNKSISLNNVSFAYPGMEEGQVLKNIDLFIPEGKVTAIVGTSGSGKTTLLKLLLKIYQQFEGEIRIGQEQATISNSDSERNRGVRFDNIGAGNWRDLCGAVMQDGFIFNDTIAKNIALGKDEIDFELLINSCKIANIYSHIESLPNGLFAKIGSDGTALSQGQKQRLLIARAVYKNPDYLFFDEATNALDANNEKVIVENLQKVFEGKTVIVIAHRLSTVKQADNIVVLHNGRIVEQGSHEQLSTAKGKYFELVKNQLELGT